MNGMISLESRHFFGTIREPLIASAASVTSIFSAIP
jgi:hypothetical protein